MIDGIFTAVDFLTLFSRYVSLWAKILCHNLRGYIWPKAKRKNAFAHYNATAREVDFFRYINNNNNNNDGKEVEALPKISKQARKTSLRILIIMRETKNFWAGFDIYQAEVLLNFEPFWKRKCFNSGETRWFFQRNIAFRCVEVNNPESLSVWWMQFLRNVKHPEKFLSWWETTWIVFLRNKALYELLGK